MGLIFFKRVFLIFSSLLLFGCSKDECGFPLDQIRFADKIQINKETYYLYTRTVGWHNKVVFFELYSAEPAFDQCQKTQAELVYKIDYDDYLEEQYIKQVTLELDSPEKLKIIYTKNKEEGFANVYDVKFSR